MSWSNLNGLCWTPQMLRLAQEREQQLAALAGVFGKTEQRLAEDRQFCADVAVCLPNTRDEIESLLVMLGRDRRKLLAHLSKGGQIFPAKVCEAALE